MNKELPIRSLLPLQILFYLHQWYLLFWLLIEILVFIYKGQVLPFASGVLAGEVILFIVLFFVDLLRIFFGTKGNLTERVYGIIVSLVIGALSVGGK
jgi:transmembrane protein 216